MPMLPILGAAAPISVDANSFMLIVVGAALAAIAATAVGTRVMLPVVVFELVVGIIIGPHVLALAQPNRFIEFFANLGLGMLFFFAGYEIDFVRIRGAPLRLGAWGWLLSLVVAYSVGGLLAWAGVVVSLLYTGSAMVTTAIGTLVPILGDVGEMRTRFELRQALSRCRRYPGKMSRPSSLPWYPTDSSRRARMKYGIVSRARLPPCMPWIQSGSRASMRSTTSLTG
jgi:Sodium/hydrogen exchanger family